MTPALSGPANGVAARYAAQIRELLALHIALRRLQSVGNDTSTAPQPLPQSAAIGSKYDLRV